MEATPRRRFGRNPGASHTRPMDRIVSSSGIEGHVFTVSTRSGHTFAVQAGAGDGSAGPGPMELMLVSLTTCSQSTLIDVIEKMRQPLEGLRVATRGQRAPKVPRIWEKVELTFLVHSDGAPDRLQRAVELAEKTCSAAAMVMKAAELESVLIQVARVDAAITRPLRRRILRPHQTLEELVVPGEDGPEAAWFAAIRGEDVVGTSGVFPEELAGDSRAPAWRLRAMATDESIRGLGVGEMLLDVSVDHARSHGAKLVWCSARTPVQAFYEERGFEVVSDVYEPENLGPHVRMARPL